MNSEKNDILLIVKIIELINKPSHKDHMSNKSSVPRNFNLFSAHVG